ncbi:MAG: phosphate-starvation-inducible PsiE family protein [Candidatus Thiodiazotropha endolucinida]
MRKPYNYHHVDKIGDAMVEVFHVVGLFVIGATVVWSGVVAYMEMINHGHASLKDILLLFIYLELGAMVGIYFKTRRLPVQFLIYIAITALTRMLTIDIKGDARQDDTDRYRRDIDVDPRHPDPALYQYHAERGKRVIPLELSKTDMRYGYKDEE